VKNIILTFRSYYLEMLKEYESTGRAEDVNEAVEYWRTGAAAATE
jgi:hypothetical protein